MRWLITLAALVPLCLVGGSVRAQSNPPFQNPAMDSNCYFPQIGVPGEIDTIYGDSANEGLGAYIHNLGAKSDGTPGNMLIGSGYDEPFVNWNEVSSGTEFNLHDLHRVAQTLKINPQYLHFGHFHNRSHTDLFDDLNWIIYWADDNGNYDTTNYSQLKSNIMGTPADFGGVGFTPYITHLVSDTIDDLVVGVITNNFPVTLDSMYLLLFRGGSSIYLKKNVSEDTSLNCFSALNPELMPTIQGNFRGTGRDDLIITDWNYNVCYFKNEVPFSLSTLRQAILFDTLWEVPDNFRTTQNNKRILWPNESLTMRVFPKKEGDSSVDWAVSIPTTGDSNNGIFIFRGGPEFGSHRITIDSAAYVILPPASLGESVWPQELIAAGDMTGTGNQVLYVTASNDGGDYWYDNYYVTGKALDSKIDIFNSGPYSIHGGDTLTANADSLEDFLNDRSWLNGTGPSGAGALVLTYGSKQIPVHLNPQFADVESIPQENGAGITFAPNPTTHSWSVATIVWPVSEEANLCVYDLLGTAVQTGKIRLLGGPEQQRIYFPNLAAGVYVVEIHGANGVARAKLVMVH
jgi:hypothetical protein